MLTLGYHYLFTHLVHVYSDFNTDEQTVCNGLKHFRLVSTAALNLNKPNKILKIRIENYLLA